MLFRRERHQGIREGAVYRTVRGWRTARVKVGNRYALWTGGSVEVTVVQPVLVGELTDLDAVAAGLGHLDGLLAELRRTSRRELSAQDRVFRVDFRFVDAAPSPPVTLSTDEVTSRLDAMDQRSGRTWTRATLAAIGSHPGTVSSELADMLDRERKTLKADIRKLKKLGLTESLDVGYRLTALGRAILGMG